MTASAELDLNAVEVLLCDADGNLFPSEEPAFEASADVTNRLLAHLGVERRYTAVELRLATTGKNFRTTAVDLATAHGASIDSATLEWWVAEEKRRVTAYLRTALSPDEGVLGPLRALATRFPLAVVSSSARTRLDACFEASGLDPLFPPGLRFSAEDSLPVPASKPDPAIYVHAGEVLDIAGPQGLAIEDAVPGVQSAVAAGFPVLGNVVFVPPGERADRATALSAAGAAAVITSWAELERMLALRPALAE
jgi:beta-phosphoglucomutase-like phosphatase (HAD superfamily)